MHSKYNDQQSIDFYAKQCNLSKYHFIHLFKEYTGLSPYAYKTRIRIEKAKDLLSSTNLSISEISNILGYNNSLYFSNLFKKTQGSHLWCIKEIYE